jgi:aryl-alcohol dehydrogenase
MLARAAVLAYQSAPFEVMDVELREPEAGEVLVEVRAAGMCHTDLAVRTPAYPLPFPLVLGHEGAGVVVAVGPGVTAVKVGAHVILSYDSCSCCANCRTGQPAYCSQFMARNLTGRMLDGSTPMKSADGAELSAHWFGQSSFATHALVTERSIVRVTEDVPFEVLAPMGCSFQTGVGAVANSLGLRLGDQIAIFGAGAVGLSAVMAARASGARAIIAVDLHRSRRELALELGATAAYDGADPDLAKQIVLATGGCDFALDTSGVAPVMNTALECLRTRGTLGIVAGNGPRISFDTLKLVTKRVVFLFEGDSVPQLFIPRLIELHVQGRLPFDRLVTTFDFDKIGDAEAASLAGEVVKPVLLNER